MSNEALKPDAIMRANVPILSFPVVDQDIQPRGDLVLCEKSTGDERTKGGIIVPDQARDNRMPHWKVITVGPGRVCPTGERVPVNVQPGDSILVAPQLGAVFELPNTSPLRALVQEACILAVVAEKPTESQ